MEKVICVSEPLLRRLIHSSVQQAAASLSAKWVTIDDACILAGRGKTTVRSLIANGTFTASHTGAKRQPVMVLRKSIDDWHQRNIVTPRKKRTA